MDPMKKRALLMEHATHPHNYRKESDYHELRAYSHTCADDLIINIKLNHDVIEDICFEGHACTIATAATSIMSEALKNKTKKEAMKHIEAYESLLSQEAYDETLLSDELVFQDVAVNANRKECAFMSWEAVKEFIKE